MLSRKDSPEEVFLNEVVLFHIWKIELHVWESLQDLRLAVLHHQLIIARDIKVNDVLHRQSLKVK
jgi:hypothetical protein